MQSETYFVDVIVPLAVPNKYTYRVPAAFNEHLQIGLRVLVQFGKTKFYTGILYKIHQQAPKGYEAKYLEGILDEQPVVKDLHLKFWDWISYYYCANPGDVMNAALPSGLKLSSTSHLQLNPDFNFEEIEHHFFTEREHQVLDALQVTLNLSFDNIAELLGIKTVQPIIQKLINKKAVLVYEDIKDKYKAKRKSFLRLQNVYLDEKALHDCLNTLEKKAFKQAEALLYFLHLNKQSETGWVAKQELSQKVDAAAIAALVKKQILEEESFEVGRLLFEKGNNTIKALSNAQEKVYSEIKTHFSADKPVLLHGVTGSGKTEIYIQLIKDTLAQNKQVLFLIPEIALTTQLITRLRAVFGEIVGVYHSRFSENERVEIWNNVLNQQGSVEVTKQGDEKHYQIILGARSSLYLPFNNLGLIIVDEEHDSSFKQHDPSPRYQARDAALYLAGLHQAKILLGSATPSLESIYNAQQQKFALVKLKNQFVESGGTSIEVCDLKHYENTQQMHACLSRPLYEAMENALAKKEQIILFQNRRGFAPYTECKQCGYVPHCVQCDVSLIYHKQQQKLVCHYCGYSVTPPSTCAACGSNQLHYKGMGTEKIEEDIEILFPKARIARMDLDSTRSKYAYKQLIDDFEAGEIDILIGTQMVTKGLDFERVNLVGILNADSLLNFPDFRSFEKAYQMITQVRGRAGRSKSKGKVFLQTSQPKHAVIDFIIENNQAEFYSSLLTERQQFDYPPFSRLFEIKVISKDLNEVNHLSNELFQLLKPSFPGKLLGPEFPLVAKIKNQYHKAILIKAPKTHNQAIRQTLFDCLNTLQNNYKNWKYRVSINVDPY